MMEYKSQYDIIQNRNGKLRELIVAEHLISESYEFSWTDSMSVIDLIVTDKKGKSINIQVKPIYGSIESSADFQANNPESKRFVNGETYFDYNVDCIAIVDIQHKMKAPLFLWKKHHKKLKCVEKHISKSTGHIRYRVNKKYYKNLQGFTNSSEVKTWRKDSDYSPYTKEWDIIHKLQDQEKEAEEKTIKMKRIEEHERESFLKTMFCMAHKSYYYVSPYNTEPEHNKFFKPTCLINDKHGTDKMHLFDQRDLYTVYHCNENSFDDYVRSELKTILREEV